jgi:trimeric autotransporter adhesin
MKKIVSIVTTSALLLFAAVWMISHLNFFSKETTEHEAEGENKMEFLREGLLQEIQKTKDPLTGTVPRERLLAAKQQVDDYFKTERAAPGIQWVERGPNNIGGRTRALIFDRNDATNNTVFAGSVAGGLWKNTNISGGGTWSQVPGVLENISITCLAQDQAAGFYNVMYFGTGETWGNLDAMRGIGIFKSTDGGATWFHVASTNNPNFYYIQKIVINSNHDVLAATSSGLYKSSNGGNSWVKILSGNISDMELAANNDIYAANFYGRVFKSTNSGTSWTDVSPTGSFSRVEIATAPSNANTLYLLCQGAGSKDVTGIFHSTTGGSSWTSRPIPTIIDQGANSIFTRSQAWYDLIASVDPNNDNTVFIGGVDALKSVNGGANWQQVTTWSLFNATGFTASQLVHADQHAIVFAPGSSTTGIWGTDGGVYYSSNLNVVSPTKPTYAPRNTGYNVTQYYAGAIHPTAGSNYLLGGAQDNGSHKLNAATITSGTAVSGGDGAFCHINQTDGVNQVTSYVYNDYYLSTNSGGTFTEEYSNLDRGSFINPTDFDNSNNFLYGDGTDNINVVGGYYFRINMAAGNPSTTARFISITNFTTTATVTHVKISPVTANRVYFGLSNGRIVYVDNANTAATTGVAGTIIRTGTGSVSGIAIDPANENHMLAVYSNYGVQSVFESFNALGASPTWTNIENNLPDIPVRSVIFYPGNTDRALLATELGVWSTDDLNGASTEWTPTNLGLANTRIDMLKVRTSDNTILAATHGRGLYTSTITNTPLPTIQFQQAKVDVPETYTTATTCGRGYRDVTVNMNIGAAPTGNVTATIAAGVAATATNNLDYQLLSNTVTFSSGSTATQSFTVRIFDDAATETLESIPLVYTITSGSTFAQTGTTLQTCQVDITDNEKAPNAPFNGSIATGLFNTSLGASSPLQSTQSDKKIQYLYRASELLARGLTAGTINSMSFVVNEKASTTPYNGLTIKIGTTTNTTLGTTFLTSTGYTTIYTAPGGGFTPLMGDNTFTVSSFTWDGTSNIVLEFCYDNSAVGTADDILEGEAVGFNCQSRLAATTGAGCGFTTGATASTFRPVITFTQPVPATTVATALSTTVNVYLGPLETVNVFDGSNNIVATIQNLSAHDYGCTSVTIDRAGTTSSQFWNTPVANNLLSKTIRVIPTTNNLTGSYQITLYYTQAEVQGWETATGQTFSNIQLVKYTGAISTITPTNTQSSNVTVVASPARGTMGTNYTLTATVNNGFSGFGAGIPGTPPSTLPVTLLSFDAKLQNEYAVLNWATSFELNNEGFEIEKSTDGFNFIKIGFVKASPLTVNGASYTFTDPAKADKLQYYRIKQIDFGGAVNYSATVVLRNNKTGIQWVSNPFVNTINIRFNESNSKHVKARLTDMNGKILTQIERQNLNTNVWRLDVSRLALSNGIYLLTVEENGKANTFKVMHTK